MPNTLAHLGLQGLLGIKWPDDIDLKWVYLGCVLPDLPWILQRLAGSLWPALNPYDLRLYSIALSTWASCLILSAGLALLTRSPWRIFLILGFNTLVHLLLDACQIKWANGVHLWAPLDWQLLRFDLFWPEDAPTWILTLGGLLFVILFWKRARRTPFSWAPVAIGRHGLAMGLFLIYLLAPLAQMHLVAAADNHFVDTLRRMDQRPGRPIQIDRVTYDRVAGQGQVRTFAGETIRADGVNLEGRAKISLKGVFTAPDRIQVQVYHVHHGRLRDLASYAGLGVVVLLWALGLFRKPRQKT